MSHPAPLGVGKTGMGQSIPLIVKESSLLDGGVFQKKIPDDRIKK